MKVGLFFGSFNPIHIGHLIISNEALFTQRIDQVWLCPTPKNPHKKKSNLLHYQKRVDLCRLAVEDKSSDIVVNDFERFLDQPNYTANSMRYLVKRYPTYSFHIIVGEDNYTTLHKWHDADWLIHSFPFMIYKRLSEHQKPKETFALYNRSHSYFGCDLINISSSTIRRRIKEGRSIQYLTPIPVVEEIELSKLYKAHD